MTAPCILSHSISGQRVPCGTSSQTLKLDGYGFTCWDFCYTSQGTINPARFWPSSVSLYRIILSDTTSPTPKDLVTLSKLENVGITTNLFDNRFRDDRSCFVSGFIFIQLINRFPTLTIFMIKHYITGSLVNCRQFPRRIICISLNCFLP